LVTERFKNHGPLFLVGLGQGGGAIRAPPSVALGPSQFCQFLPFQLFFVYKGVYEGMVWAMLRAYLGVFR